jgi:hypothetical protein
LEALKLLPKGEAKRVARIEAREGKPAPSRWHLLVHAPEEATGVREYVIAGDEIVASRNVSQFAESLKESDVVGAEAIRIDSDKASKLAQQYALANNATVAVMDYELMREGDGAAPLWKISCLDESGKTVGTLVLTASKGTVVSHDGFPIEPVAMQEKLTVEAAELVGDGEKAEADGMTAAATATTAAVAATAATASSGVTTDKPAATPTPKKKKTSTTSTKTRSRSSEDEDRPRAPRFFRRAGGKLQKFFTGKDTISR